MGVGGVSLGGLSTSAESRLRDRSRIELPKRYLQTLQLKKEGRRVAVKREVDPLVRLFLRTSNGNDWNNVCGGIVGFTKLHACVAEGCRVKKHVIKEPQLLPDRIYIRTPQVGEKRSVYLHPSVAVNEVDDNFMTSLLNEERTVDA